MVVFFSNGLMCLKGLGIEDLVLVVKCNLYVDSLVLQLANR